MAETMNEVLAALKARTAYVIEFHREIGEDMDLLPEHNAFAFVLGEPDGPAIIVEGSIAGDGLAASVTVWAAAANGEPLSLIEFDGKMMHTLNLAPQHEHPLE